VFAHQFEQLGCASALGDDVVTGTFQEAREAFAKGDVVVGDNDALAAPSPVLCFGLAARRLSRTRLCPLTATWDWGGPV
jgi:hypothetical protein